MNTTPDNQQRFALPTWMQPGYQTVDWGLVLMIALSMMAALPFLIHPSLPRETDAELHVFRTAELTYNIQNGALYPRWAPNFWYGYGYPFFNYYGSFTYYLASGFGMLTGGGAVAGAKFVFVLGQVLAGVGAYTFVRRRWSAPAGMVSGVVYAFSPYVMLIDPHMRGDMAESFALGLLPCVLWAFDRCLADGRGFHLAAAVMLLAALIFTHNLMAVIGFAVLLGWLLWLRLVAREVEGRRWGYTWLAVLLGLGLASFFWAPVLLEAGEVQLDRLTGPGHFDYRNHFLSLGELLSPSPRLDLGAVNPEYAFNLGIMTWVLALVGASALLYRARAPVSPPRPDDETATLQEWEQRLARKAIDIRDHQLSPPGGSRDMLYFAAVGLLLIFLMLPASRVVWQVVPKMELLQFPWRLLGAASFCLAVLAGAATRWLYHLDVRLYPLALGTLIVVPMLGAMTAAFPPDWDTEFGSTSPAAYINFELSGVALGTTSGSEYLPKTVLVPPEPQATLIESYRRTGAIDKVNRATLPDGTIVNTVYHRPTEDRFIVQSDQPFLLRLYTFAFAGWRVEIDGQNVAYEIAEPEGFIVVPVPANAREVRVYLGTTPARTFALMLSLASLVGLMGLYVFIERSPSHGPTPPADKLGRRAATAVLAAGVMFMIIRLAADAWPDTFYQRTPAGEVPEPAQAALYVPFEHNIELLAYDLPDTSAHPGDTLRVTLYWHTTGEVPDNYQVFVHLAPLGSDTPLAQSDKLNPGDYPTTRWEPDRYVRDAHVIDLPDDLPAGDYLLTFGLYDRDTDTRLLTEGEYPDDKAIVPAFIEIK